MTDSGVTADQVETFVLDLTKAIGAHHLYDEANPSYQRFIGALRDDFRALVEEVEQVELVVSEDRLTWNGATVYQSTNRTESLAFLLHKDGVRGLRFLRGFEERDVEELLDVLERARYQRTEGEDLITLLWERDLPTVQYSAAELLTRGVEIPEPSGDVDFDLLAVQKMALQEDRDGEQVGVGVEEGAGEEPEALEWAERGTAAPELHPTLHVLTQGELAQLEVEIERERGRDLPHDVATALLDSLEVEEGEDRDHVLRCVGAILLDLVEAGALEGALEVIREVDALVDRDGKGETAGLDVALDGMERGDLVAGLVDALGAGEEGRSLFRSYVPYLRGGALEELYREASERRDTPSGVELEGAIREVASARPRAVIEVLRSEDPRVLAGAAATLAELGIGGASELLAPLLDHEDGELRLAATRALAVDAEGAARLERALHDPDSKVRIAAVAGLVEHECTSAAETFEGVVRDRAFRGRGLSEIRAFLDAWARLGGSDAVPLLGEILNDRGLLGASYSSEMRASAARALALVANQAARRELARAAGDKDTLVHHAVEQATRREERE